MKVNMAPSKDSNPKDDSNNCTNPYDPFRALKGFVDSQIQLVTDMTDRLSSSFNEDDTRRGEDERKPTDAWWQELSSFLEEGRRKAQHAYSFLDDKSTEDGMWQALHDAQQLGRAVMLRGGAYDGLAPSDFLWRSLYDPARLSAAPALSHIDWNRALVDLRFANEGSDLTTDAQWAAMNREWRTEEASKRRLWAEVLAGQQLARDDFEPLGMYRQIRDTLGDAFREMSPRETSEPNTELDLFDRFHNEEASKDPRGRVVQSMYRQERRVLPDGRVETKSIQRKRYEDGSEEVSESDDGSHNKPNDITNEHSTEVEHSGSQSNRSWFWK